MEEYQLSNQEKKDLDEFFMSHFKEPAPIKRNDYLKVVHGIMFFGEKIALAQVLKDDWHKGFWTDAGGKVNENESILKALVREIREETGVELYSIYHTDFRSELVDCFVYDERKIKTFLFKVKFESENQFALVENLEPDKQSDWRLFTVEEALKLQLMPSVRDYLESLRP